MWEWNLGDSNLQKFQAVSASPQGSLVYSANHKYNDERQPTVSASGGRPLYTRFRCLVPVLLNAIEPSFPVACFAKEFAVNIYKHTHKYKYKYK